VAEYCFSYEYCVRIIFLPLQYWDETFWRIIHGYSFSELNTDFESSVYEKSKVGKSQKHKSAHYVFIYLTFALYALFDMSDDLHSEIDQCYKSDH